MQAMRCESSSPSSSVVVVAVAVVVVAHYGTAKKRAGISSYLLGAKRWLEIHGCFSTRGLKTKAKSEFGIDGRRGPQTGSCCTMDVQPMWYMLCCLGYAV